MLPPPDRSGLASATAWEKVVYCARIKTRKFRYFPIVMAGLVSGHPRPNVSLLVFVCLTDGAGEDIDTRSRSLRDEGMAGTSPAMTHTERFSSLETNRVYRAIRYDSGDRSLHHFTAFHPFLTLSLTLFSNNSMICPSSSEIATSRCKGSLRSELKFV